MINAREVVILFYVRKSEVGKVLIKKSSRKSATVNIIIGDYSRTFNEVKLKIYFLF